MKPAPLTPTRAVQLLNQNDPTLIECDLSGNATYTIKSATFTKEVATALKSNTHLKKLYLSNLGVTDASIKFIAEALKVNKTLNYLNLSKNKFGSAGLIDLAEAIGSNQTLVDIDLLGQSQSFGENALSKVIEMFNYNITLKNISWRLHSRQSFAINKLIVRNNEIERRLASGKSCMDILPESRKAEFIGIGEEPLTPHNPTPPTPLPRPEDPPNYDVKENHKEQPQESQLVSETTAEQTPHVEDHNNNYPKSPRDHVPTFQRPKPVPSPQPIVGLSTEQVGKTVAQRIQTTGQGKMLSRYLQATQVDIKEVETKVNPPEGVGVNKVASIWQSRFEEKVPDPTQGETKEVETKVNPPEGVGLNKVASIWQSRFEEKVPDPTQGDTKEVETKVNPPEGVGLNKVASIWQSRFEEKVPDPTQSDTQEVETKVNPPEGVGVKKVASIWQNRFEEKVPDPTQGDTKEVETKVNEGVGVKKVASIWQNRFEEKVPDPTQGDTKEVETKVNPPEGVGVNKVASIWQSRFEEKVPDPTQGDTKEVETKVNPPEGVGLNKVASIWQSRFEEKAPDLSLSPRKYAPPERSTPGETPRVAATWQSKVDQNARETEIPKISEQPVKSVGVTGVAAKWQSKVDQSTSEMDIPRISEQPVKSAGVTGIAAVFESKGVSDAPLVRTPTRSKGSFINKVASVWSAHEHEVKRTTVELPPGTGVSRVASMWQQMEEESVVGTPSKQASKIIPNPVLQRKESLALKERPVLNSNAEESMLSPRTTQIEKSDPQDTPVSPRYFEPENQIPNTNIEQIENTTNQD